MQGRIALSEGVRELQADRSLAHILIVEDGPGMQSWLQRIFSAPGHYVNTRASVRAEFEAFRNVQSGAVRLHLIRPDTNGHKIYLSMGTGQPDIPVIVVAPISEVLKKAMPQERGADDYVSGPLVHQESALQFERSLLREQKPAAPVEAYSLGECVIDFAKMTARRAGKVVAVTTLEFKLLRYFLNHPERVLSRQELLDEVWGYNCYPTTRTVDNQILKLRRKLEPDPTEPRYFRTVYGAGYKFVPQ